MLVAIAARFGFATLACVSTLAVAAADAIDVKVERRAEQIVVDVSAHIPASLAHTWEVLTDYEHMPAFIQNIKSSRVVRREGNVLEVAQSGETTFAFMRFSYASVRRAELVPMHEIRTSLVSGDFKAYASTTRLVEQGGQTWVTYHGEYVPARTLPPLIGPEIIATQTKKHYQQLSDEVLRRQIQRPAAR